ncbi:MAG: aldehyde dehydrogenase family protein [Actinobacteria bacterium]|nr:aldehyde dehydrogenase family protein [Actinomycetota bacterium]
MVTMPFYVAGNPTTTADLLDVHSPYDGSVVGSYSVPSAEDIESAIAAAVAVQPTTRTLSAATRATALDHVSATIAQRSDEVAALISAESGKPMMWARAEVSRAVSTFRWAAEEARRFSGEVQRLDTDPAAVGRMAVVRRFAAGPVLGISPFNFPLNLVAHKVAPAIAVGAPIVLKPAPKTPLSALLLGEILSETDLPPGSWSILPAADADAPGMVSDSRLPIISFTGSERVGYAIQSAVPHKRVILELGGNAAAVVMADYASERDLDWAASRIATFGNYQAGQSCISVQRVYVHSSLAAEFTEILTAKVAGLATGDPRDPETVVGPMINVEAAERVDGWVQEAVTEGAEILTGGTREGTQVAPTLLTNVSDESKCYTEEVFGPVMTLRTFDSVDEAFELVNDSRFGLQAGIFTNDIHVAFRAQATLDVGGVIIGDVPSYRADQMPYGGVKNSGVGREGLRHAMDDYTDVRVMVLTGLEL